MTKIQIELHVHPYFENYSMLDLVNAIDAAGLNVVALQKLGGKFYDEVRKLADGLKTHGYKVDSDDIAIKLERDSKQIYILRSAEIPTSDGFHLLTIGHDIFPPYLPMRNIIYQALEGGCFVVWDHPFANARYPMFPVSKRRRDEIERVCKDYNNQMALEWNGYCLRQYWGMLGPFGLDANRKVLEFSEMLKQQGYNIPVVTDTDLHGRDKNSLREMGRARLIADIDTTSGRDIVQSLRNSVFTGSHQNTYRTVSLRHFILYFMIPLFLEMAFGVDLRSRG